MPGQMLHETVAICGRFEARHAAWQKSSKRLKTKRKIACIDRAFRWRCGGESVKKIAP
jgi:kynureninase